MRLKNYFIGPKNLLLVYSTSFASNCVCVGKTKTVSILRLQEEGARLGYTDTVFKEFENYV